MPIATGLTQKAGQMAIVDIPLSHIKMSLENENFHDDSQIERLAAIIKKQGFDVPIVIDEQNVILKGEGRYRALKHLKRETAPCIIKAGLSEKQKRMLRISDNQIASLSEFDPVKLKSSVGDFTDDEISLIGFDDSELKDILSTKLDLDLDDDEGEKDMGPRKESFKVPLCFQTMEDKVKFIDLMNHLRDAGRGERYEDIVLSLAEQAKAETEQG